MQKGILNFRVDGIEEKVNYSNGKQEQFDLSGRRISSLKRGVNILRQADGTVRKVLVK